LLCHNSTQIVCLEWIDSKLNFNSVLEGHLLPINDLIISSQSDVVTCSDDFTVRLWQGEEPFRTSKILAGHTAQIRCLESYREYIFSGSSENEVLVWQDRKLLHRIQAHSSVEALMSCVEAGYLVVATRSSEVEVYSLAHLAHKKLPRLYTVKLLE